MPDDQPTRKRPPNKVLPAVECLRECFDYDPETGVLVWKRRPRGHFPTSTGWKIANKRFPGAVAGIVHRTGYRYVNINGIDYGAHRIAWKLMTSWEPPSEIDHINGDCADNRWGNLRMANRSEQMRNRKLNKNNTSGYRGVVRDHGRWRARVRINGVGRDIGHFATCGEAAAAYETAAREAYGEFYRGDT